ncbi:MAG: cyclodeaminase [Acidimicrobiia bacterium]
MGAILVLTESDLRQAVGLGPDELAAVEAVYPIISSGKASMPPIMRIDVPENNGEIDIKSAYLPGYPGIAVKLSAGFFNNPSRGLPSLGGLMVVLDSETGIPQSALFDNGYLTDLRTGLAGAVAAKHLAKEGEVVMGIIGAGVQALLQFKALNLVRKVTRGVIWARRPEAALRFADEVSSTTGIEFELAGSVTDVLAGADLVATTTPATEPLVDVSMLHPGLHITAVGSDAENKQELDGDVVAAADAFVCDSIAQSSRLGELRAALDAGFDKSEAIELGRVIDGSLPGRRSEDEVTVCDLTGTGAQDTAIASLAVQRCMEIGLGTTIET